VLTVQPASGYIGVISIVIVAEDSSTVSVTETMTVTVRPPVANRAPQLSWNMSVNFTVPQDCILSLLSLGAIIDDPDVQLFAHLTGPALRVDLSAASGALYVDGASSDIVMTSFTSSTGTVGPAVCSYSGSPAQCAESCCAVPALTMHGSRLALMSALQSAVFRPAAGFVGTDVLLISVSDEGCCGTGGPLTSSTAVNIHVLARNRAPSVTLANLSPASWVVRAFSNTSLTLPAVSVVDVDSAGGSLNCTLRVSAGTISLSSIAGLSFTVGSGLNDSMMVFHGTDIAITAALAGMAFTPPSGVQALDTLISFEVTDAVSGTVGGSQTTRLYLLVQLQESIPSSFVNLGELDVVPPVRINQGVWNAWVGLTAAPVYESSPVAEMQVEVSAPPGTLVSLVHENGVRCTMGSISSRPGASGATVDQRFEHELASSPLSLSCVARSQELNRILRSFRFQRGTCGPASFNLTVRSSETLGTIAAAFFVVVC